ncbi:3'-5' exonuclease [Neisseria sp. ZJ106]|uniref:Exonuclease domain-containing protein n=1 Tax=Neisseria lisongii TaxID=2912188 RepID=A0ABY7RH73_9NEIS|nr:3'-5' exonuclease family protein [Neisseria lisongii]MCF7522146.1 3'-5' exonuclease [Neisseria lisongii]WCL70907.1 exonuclease domain-containing protein [Neisseria lisongii]
MADISHWPALAAVFSRFGLPVAVVDLESTGGNFYQDRITEIALIRFENGKIRRYEQLVNPQQPISEFIENLTGISNETVAHAPAFADIAADLLPLLQHSLVVAHNSRFDHTFLRHEFARAGIDFAGPALCTVQLSRRLYPQEYKHNLDSIIERFDIPVANRHRAMTDVVALCDFLERSLQEHSPDEWLQQSQSLLRPAMLPSTLPPDLQGQIYALPDSAGAAVWLDAHSQALSVEAYEHAYSEISAAFSRKKLPPYLQAAAQIRFMPAIGTLHALWLKAQAALEHRLMPSKNGKYFFTVQFTPSAQGVLQAKIVPLNNGWHERKPNGLFLHKKAAKRALADWAQTHDLCPALLDILPTTYAANQPCPLQALGSCDGNCRSSSGIERHNRLIEQYAPQLPVADWGKLHEFDVTERHPLNGKSITFRCSGGAIALPDGRWYFDDTLHAALKAAVKKNKADIQPVK